MAILSSASKISYIQETITAQNAVLIQKTIAHPYNLLKALKERLAPTDSARYLSLEKSYERLKKGPRARTSKYGWTSGGKMYIDASTNKLAEVSGDCPVRDFLLAVYSKDPALRRLNKTLKTAILAPWIRLLKIIDTILDFIQQQRGEMTTGLLLPTKVQLGNQTKPSEVVVMVTLKPLHLKDL
ncbi:hypothetical protein MMC22_005268 [Lobaria immixta]|nr:hypothetical protein [Lobaria immixta]